MKRWQRMRVFIFQGVNAALGVGLIVLGSIGGLLPIVLLGVAFVAMAALLVVLTLRQPVTDPKPQAPRSPR